MYVRPYPGYGNVQAMAYRHGVVMNAQPGLPRDTFERPRYWVSQVQSTPAPAWKRWIKGLGEALSQSATMAKVVAMFYPPAAPAAATAEVVAPVVSMATSQIDVRPRPLVSMTRSAYNPWFM